MCVQSLGGENPLEEEMVTHSNAFTWEIPRIEEAGGLQSMGSQKRHDLVTKQQQQDQRTESRDLNKYLYTHIHSNIIHSSQDMETTQVSIKRWISRDFPGGPVV